MNKLTLKPDDLIVKSLTAFIRDAGNQFQARRADQNLDTKYLLKRFRMEGVGFVTKTLPSFGKHFDNALKCGQFSPFPAFKRGKGALPCFLNGLTKRIFSLDGALLDSPDVDAMRLLRQLAYMFYKLEGDYPQEKTNEAINDFCSVDHELGGSVDYLPQTYGLVYHASEIIRDIFHDFDPGNITPRPGPGQCSTRVAHELRYEPLVKYTKVHAAFPYSQYFYTNSRHLLDSLEVYRNLPKSHYSISRLAIVPKDSRGPRIICMEPPELMWLQQGLGRAIMDCLEAHPLTRGQVNFTDQTVNGRLALSSSRLRNYATLDMKEASDRISLHLVEMLFDEVPKLQRALLSLSSDGIELPSGDIIRKNKFAPMGSALCFPIMSVVHFALAVASIKLATGRSHKAIAKTVFVYGDDMIVKTEHAEHLIADFPTLSLKFNESKCCIEGHFRESCGVDAYMGTDITPQRVKTYTHSKRDPSHLSSALAMYHGFFNRGLWQLAKVWQDRISDTWGWLPCVSKNSGALGWIVPRSHLIEANKASFRWNHKLQCYSVKARLSTTKPDRYFIGGWEQLLRALNHVRGGGSELFTKRDQSKMGWSRIPLSAL